MSGEGGAAGHPPPHLPVLFHEVLAGLRVQPGGQYIDGTVGAGGHAEGLLQASAPDGRLIGLDRDPAALAVARQRLARFGRRVVLVHDSYVRLAAAAQAQGWRHAEGILLDLGFSSLQVADARRGFSFSADGPLDMRYDPSGGVTAADLVNDLPADELADILQRYGEERHSRRIARAIVAARPITGTGRLAEIVARARPRSGRLHPATRTFQALRIAVNDELNALTEALPEAVRLLAPGGRLAVIAFHSLEDRIVKETFRRLARPPAYDADQPAAPGPGEAFTPSVREATRKPVLASPAEVSRNPRARSARLRIVEKLALA